MSLLIGAVFIVIAGLGLYRMPDLFMRMSMTTKASTMGIGFMLMGATIHLYTDRPVVTKLIAMAIFIFLTAPVSAHMLGRAGYRDALTQLWTGTWVDELHDQYNRRQHTLDSLDEAELAIANQRKQV
ncbi:MAG: Na+/H+ antiporter subunit G [Chloroflexi bacterium]|nr:Na+/H+ antiporter subunit G [Chloroflexota bacterium]